MASHHPSSPGEEGAPAPAAVTRIPIQHLPRPYRPPPLRPSLPLGIAVISILLAIAAVLVLLTGALILLSALAGSALIPTTLLITTTVDPWGAAILIVLGGVVLAVARALWDLERWALYVGVGGSFAGLTYLFFTGSITVLFLLLLALFVYLLTVRHHFY